MEDRLSSGFLVMRMADFGKLICNYNFI